MKKAFGLVLALILILLLSASCGIAQDKYDKVTSDLTAAQVQIQKVQGDLAAKNTELSTKASELKAAQDKLGKAKAEVEIFNAIFIPAMSGELNNMSEAEGINLFFNLRDKVKAIGDPTLTAKLQAVIDSGSSDETVILPFFVYLLEDISRALE
jgi:hypothetical protein